MKNSAFLTLGLAVLGVGFFLLMNHNGADAKNLSYPKARIEPVEETFGGVEIRDPYRWMEDFENEEVKAWALKENKLTETYLAGDIFKQTFDRLKSLADFDLSFASVGRGKGIFYFQRPKGGGKNTLYVLNPEKTLLIRSEDIHDDDMTEPVIGSTNLTATLWPNIAGNFVAFGYSDRASNWFKIKIIDVKTKHVLPEVITGIYGGLSSVSWKPDGSGFFYTKYRPETQESNVGARPVAIGVFFHRLGTAAEGDQNVFSLSGDASGVFFPIVSQDGKYLLIGSKSSATFTDTFLVFDLNNLEQDPVRLFEDSPAKYNYLGSSGSRLYFQTDQEAPNGKIISADLSEGGEISVIVPEGEEAMLAGSTAGGDVYGFIGQHFVLGYLVDGAPNLKIFDKKGNLKHQIDLPTGASIWGGISGLSNNKYATFSILGILDPRTLYSLNVESGEAVKVEAAELPVNADEIEIKRVFFTSKDQTRVPMFIVHKKGLKLNGKNPAFIYGYGFHSWVSFVWYQPHILHFIELGGVYAIPGLRGGGEYGEDWHRAGIKLNRQNAVDDFVWAGKWLVENGYTSRKKLVANGGSASGPLAGEIAVKYDDVFAAAIIDIPFTDLVRAYHYGTGVYLIGEYGSPEIPEEAAMLVKHSPYYNSQKPACFMPTLLLVGEKDQTATPFHGYKMTAAMQSNQTCGNPVLMKLMMNTGHNFGTSPDQIADSRTTQIVFLRKVLGF